MKAMLVAAVLAGSVIESGAQELELAPIVVEGTFELRPTPSVTDLFTLHLQRQIETHRALQEAVSRSPFFYAPFWRYLPRIESSLIDSSQFFTPNYLSADYRNTERALQDSRKHSLFDNR